MGVPRRKFPLHAKGPGEPPRGCATSPNLSRRQAVECSLAIVPSQSFITGTVINWDAGGISATVLQWRMMGKVEEDERLLLDIAKANPDVLRSPEPEVFIIGADHAGHIMELHVRLAGDARQRLKAISALNHTLLTELARLPGTGAGTQPLSLRAAA